jgi:Ca-activated chloride channel homolog
MRFSSKFSLLVITLIASLSILFPHLTPAQSALDVVNITPRAQPVLAANSMTPTIRKSVDLVLVPVSVTDDMERLVLGLRRENFTLSEGKHREEIRHFSSEDGPVSVGVVVDMSGSMKDKVDRVREAVHDFCEAANTQDEFFLITFSDQPRLLTDFTSADKVEQQLLFAQAGGRTALLDAIYMGLRKMRQAKYARKALFIISDGGDNHSRYSEGEVRRAIREADVMVYSIGTFDRYVPTAEEQLGPWLLSDIAGVTGGQSFVLDRLNEMPAIARHIGNQLRTQYVLGYRPSEVPNDGKWHKISVRLILPKHLPFFRVHARTGYYAAKNDSAPTGGGQ